MDKYFILFEKWFNLKEKDWKRKGIIIDEAILATHAHQYHLKISSEYGIGTISLYESNGLYWVDFEAGNYDYDVMFFRSNITFLGQESISVQEREFVEYMLWHDV